MPDQQAPGHARSTEDDMIYTIRSALAAKTPIVVATVTDGGRCALMNAANDWLPRGCLTVISMLIGKAEDVLDEQPIPRSEEDRRIAAFVHEWADALERLENGLEDLERERKEAAAAIGNFEGGAAQADPEEVPAAAQPAQP